MDDRVKQGVQRAIVLAEKTGRITYAELNALLPPIEVTSREIEDILAELLDHGIHVIEG